MARISIDRKLCKGCRLCVDACPRGLIELDESINALGDRYVRQRDDKDCNGCALCAVMCPDSAISVYK